LKKTALLFLSACGLIVSCNQPNVSPAGSSSPPAASSPAGARIDKPFTLAVSGADCYSGTGKNAGDVAFGFPNRGADAALRFTIGPLRDGLSPGQENNKAYSGPGDYPNVGIAGKAPGQKPFVGYGTIIVNANEESGSFRLADGSASGTWNCGHKLPR
jgi:hypothetical protein